MKKSKGILYTSYLANHKVWKPMKLYKISVMLYTPKWWDLRKEGIDRLGGLTPGELIFNTYKNGFINEEQFREMFLDRLSTNEESIKDMNSIKKTLDLGTDVLLLCMESKKDIESGKKFCHRQMIAEVFDEMGYETKEL